VRVDVKHTIGVRPVAVKPITKCIHPVQQAQILVLEDMKMGYVTLSLVKNMNLEKVEVIA